MFTQKLVLAFKRYKNNQVVSQLLVIYQQDLSMTRTLHSYFFNLNQVSPMQSDFTFHS